MMMMMFGNNACDWLTMPEHKCSPDAKTQMLRCFLSPGGLTIAGSPALRLVCQAAKTFVSVKLANNRFPLSVDSNPSFIYACSHKKDYKSNDLTTRWPSIPVAANWSGGRWRAESFLHQEEGFEPPWSPISSLSPVVSMVITLSPRSSPGTQWPSLGSRLATLLWAETTMRLLPFLLP